MYRNRFFQWGITVIYPFFMYFALYADWRWGAAWLYFVIWGVYALLWAGGTYLVIGTCLQFITGLMFLVFLAPVSGSYFEVLPKFGFIAALLIAVIQYGIIRIRNRVSNSGII